MTNTDITPELLRAIAEWTDNRPTIGSITVSRILRKEADSLEREQADEKRIDELAEVFHEGRRTEVAGVIGWEGLTDRSRDVYRAGIRAVLSHLEQERSERYADAKAMLAHRNRSARGASESCTKPENQQVTPRAREPRMWGDLCEVPPGVHTVVDKDGDRYLRDPRAENGWTVERSCAPIDEYMSFEHAPFTEVIADA